MPNGKPKRVAKKKTAKKVEQTPEQAKRLAWKLIENTNGALMRAVDDYMHHCPKKTVANGKAKKIVSAKPDKDYCLQQCRNIAGRLKGWK